MRLIRNLAALSFALALVACGSATDATAPASTSTAEVIIARYDLQQVGGRELPLTYSGGGASWRITGGHYFLRADNSYTFGYDYDGVTRTGSIGRYVRVDPTTIQFYLAPGSYPASQFYQERGGLFSTAKISGSLMTVTYEDFMDFEIEEYVLSGS